MRKIVASGAVFALPALALSACYAPETPSSTPGTTPAIWTGSPPPAAPPGEGGEPEAEGQAQNQTTGETLSADLRMADGTPVATATIEFTGDYATVTVRTTTPGELTPGFHGLHPSGR